MTSRRIAEDLWHDAVYRKLLQDTAVAQVLSDHFAKPGTPLLRELLERRERAIGDVANRLGEGPPARSVGITPCRYGWWAVHYQRPGVLSDLVRFEMAWQRTRGRWTARDPMPRFEFTRRCAA